MEADLRYQSVLDVLDNLQDQLKVAKEGLRLHDGSLSRHRRDIELAREEAAHRASDMRLLNAQVESILPRLCRCGQGSPVREEEEILKVEGEICESGKVEEEEEVDLEYASEDEYFPAPEAVAEDKGPSQVDASL